MRRRSHACSTRSCTRPGSNTLTRRYFKTRGVDPGIESFVALDIELTDRITHPVAGATATRYGGNLPRVFQAVLDDYPFGAAHAHAGLRG